MALDFSKDEKCQGFIVHLPDAPSVLFPANLVTFEDDLVSFWKRTWATEKAEETYVIDYDSWGGAYYGTRMVDREKSNDKLISFVRHFSFVEPVISDD